MVFEFMVKGLALLLTAFVAWLCIFVIARTIFIAYFQTKTTFTRPRQISFTKSHQKEMNGGKEK